jgi:nucleotide-binding universal stress UspA family protein
LRTYLTVVDETEEARVALRFAARRAAKTGGTVLILAMVEPVEFVAFGNVQATMEQEAHEHAAALVQSAAGAIVAEAGITPSIVVRSGSPAEAVRTLLASEAGIAALVLGAAANGPPGPLVTQFTSSEAGSLPCPLMIVPGRLSSEELDRVS